MNLEFEITDILKRLHTIENILFEMTEIIDMARNYDERLKKLEYQPKGKEIKMEAHANIQAQESLVKNTLIEKGYTLYSQLITFLKSVPVNQVSMQLAYQNLDQGMHWFKEIILAAQIIQGGALPANEPVAPENNEIEKSEIAEENVAPVNPNTDNNLHAEC